MAQHPMEIHDDESLLGNYYKSFEEKEVEGFLETDTLKPNR